MAPAIDKFFPSSELDCLFNDQGFVFISLEISNLRGLGAIKMHFLVFCNTKQCGLVLRWESSCEQLTDEGQCSSLKPDPLDLEGSIRDSVDETLGEGYCVSCFPMAFSQEARASHVLHL